MMPRYPLHWVLVLVTLIVVATLFMLHYPSSQPQYYLPYAGSAVEKALEGNRPQPLLDDIFNATLGFEKIFVVSIPSRTDRRDNMVLQAAVLNIELEFIDAPKGEEVAEKSIPMDETSEHLEGGALGCWRGHMDAIHEIVRRNLTSALILEDDVDWDLRLMDQMRSFALSTRALIQPLSDSPGSYADPTYPKPRTNSPTSVPDLDFFNLPNTTEPAVSPYGDGWDLFWLGHCGLSFPFTTSSQIPKGRVIHQNDVTVAPKKNLWSFNHPWILVEDYPAHTSAVSHAQEGICAHAYAVSQKGARQMLTDVALKPPRDAFDFLLRFYCEGENGRKYHNCLGIQPSLFNKYNPAGQLSSASNIGDHSGYREKDASDMIRWSVRLNAEKLIEGRTDFDDQYPDEDEDEETWMRNADTE